jgi:hypothetical protein
MRPVPESPIPNPDFLTPEARRRAIAEVLARGVVRHLSPLPSQPTFSAGRSSENPSDCSGSELASEPGKSVTVPAG